MFQATRGFVADPVPPGRDSGAEAESTLAAVLSAYEGPRDAADLFEAGRAGVSVLLKAAGSAQGGASQDRILDLLAGGSASRGPRFRPRL